MLKLLCDLDKCIFNFERETRRQTTATTFTIHSSHPQHQLIFSLALMPDKTTKIVAGNDGNIEDFPFIAEIQRRESRNEPWEHWCGAIVVGIAGGENAAIEDFRYVARIEKGDNGGPLTCKTTDGTTVLNGIFAWQYATCNGNRSTAYTNNPNYACWLKRQTGIEGYPLN
ncbi:unnamed protein product [Mytilus coruscus]|uniref:Uncharacterized protein n=1 Tax=Mytilus coruscus TaxID=42192 RepID=A0A6J8BWD1_MYTCO|nr:unnamed protein product [Mytilus coruscus]